MKLTSLLVVLSLALILHVADARRRRCCGICGITPQPCPTLIPQTCPPPVIPQDCPVCPSTELPPPLMSTSTPPGTTTTDCKCSPSGVDVVFVIDSSGSIGSENFRIMLNFINELVAAVFLRAHGEIRVAANTYTHEAKLHFKLNEYNGLKQIQAAINNITYEKGDSNLLAGLNNVLSEIIGKENGDRADADNLIILLTDGESTHDPMKAVDKLFKSNNTLMAVGIGNDVIRTNLEYMTRNNNRVFRVKDFEQLTEIVDTLALGACVEDCPADYPDSVIFYKDMVFKSNNDLPYVGKFVTCEICD